jgi:amidase
MAPAALLAALALSSAAPTIEERSLADLAADLAAGRVKAADLVLAYQARIAAMDRQGPALNAVIALNPHALEEARVIDAKRARKEPLPPLAGLPILVKDNIETGDDMATTAGSLALADNVTGRDAPVTARLKASGAIILGKTNLSEWANFRSSRSISGWSGVGGLVRNPYALDRNACGSSSGTGAAIAASFAAAGVGTETDGSITCPSSLNGLVGLKPTVGLISRSRIAPISHTQDTAGPMARSVLDAAMLLSAMAGKDAADPATAAQPASLPDYVAAARATPAVFKGVRLGVLRYATHLDPEDDRLFAAALERLKAAGAQIIEIDDYRPDPADGAAEHIVLVTEFKTDLEAYLREAAPAVRTRTLADLIAFNAATPRELALFGQETFETSAKAPPLTDPTYLAAVRRGRESSGVQGIDRLLQRDRLDALVAPSYGPAWRTDILIGDKDEGAVSSLAARSGYPHLTVPMGEIRGMPVGFSFIGSAWSEARLLSLGAGFEALVQGRKAPTYRASVEDDVGSRPDLAPAKRLSP